MAKDEKADQKPAAACPVCGKPPADKTRPFCSKHCANVDLHRWLSGAYAIAGAPIDDQDPEFYQSDHPGADEA